MENQIEMDARKSPAALFEIRKQIVRPHEKGIGPAAIKEQTGIGWGAMRKAIDLFDAGGTGGAEADAPRMQERRGEDARAGQREKQMREDICDKRPEQVKMDFAPWTREAVLVCVREHFGVDMPVRTAGEYLKRRGFTPQKPVKVAYEQKPEAVKRRLDEEYPAISARDTLRAGSRQRFSMISSANSQGKRHWMIIDGAFNADRLIEFTESLAKDAPGKAFLAMDNLKARRRKPVKEWLEKNKERIEVFYLPSYGPELNPDERLNADLKHAITTSVPRRTRPGLLKKPGEHMNMAKSSPERVKTYFNDKHVAYAADSQ